MNFFKIILGILYTGIIFGNNSFAQKNSNTGIEFSFSIDSAQKYRAAFGLELVFLGSANNEYIFYNKGSEDTLDITLYGTADSIYLIKDSVYNVSYEINPGFPSTFGMIIKKNSVLIFEGITDWELNSTVSLIDSSDLKVELSRILEDETLISDECGNRITPVEYKFSIGNESVLLRQNEIKIINTTKINLGQSQKVEYSGKCLDDGINGISFTAINNIEI